MSDNDTPILNKYLLDEQWYGPFKLTDIKRIAKLSDEDEDIYAQNDLSESLARIIGNIFINETSKFYESEEGKKINKILAENKNKNKSKDMIDILKELVKYNIDIDNDIININNHSILTIDINKFINSLSNNIPTDMYVIKNLIPMDDNALDKIIEGIQNEVKQKKDTKSAFNKLMDRRRRFTNVDELYGGSFQQNANVKIGEYINTNIDIIKSSINAVKSWRNVNLGHFSLGTPKELAQFTFKILEKFKNSGGNYIAYDDIPDTLQKSFEYYITTYGDEESYDRFKLSISSIKSEFKDDLGNIRIPFKYDNSGGIKSNSKDYTILPLSNFATNELLMKSFYEILDDAHKYTSNPGANENNIYAGETLILMIYSINRLVYKLLDQIIYTFEEHVKYISNNKSHLEFIIQNMRKSLYDFYKLIIDNRMVTYFNLNNAGSIYGIDYGINNDNKPDMKDNNLKPDTTNTFIRIFSYDKISREVKHIKKDNFPIEIDKTTQGGNTTYVLKKKDIIERYTEFFDAKEDTIERYTKEILSIGGLIQDPKIARITLTSLKKYYSADVKNKMSAIKCIDFILKKMRVNLHIDDVKNIKTYLEQRYVQIAEARLEKRHIIANAVVNEVAEKYKYYREKMYIGYINFYKFIIYFEKNIDSIMGDVNVAKKIALDKELYIVTIEYYRLLSMAFKIMATEFYNYFENWYSIMRHKKIFKHIELPQKYYNILVSYLNNIEKELLYDINNYGIDKKTLVDMNNKINEYRSKLEGNVFKTHIDKLHIFSKSSITISSNKKTIKIIAGEGSDLNSNDILGANRPLKYESKDDRKKNIDKDILKSTNRETNKDTEKGKYIGKDMDKNITHERISKTPEMVEQYFNTDRPTNTGIGSQIFWKNLINRFKGAHIFIPVIYQSNIGVIHKIFNLSAFAYYGKYSKDFLMGPNELVKKYGTTKLNINMVVIVSNQDRDIYKLEWKAVNGRFIEALKKFDIRKMRHIIYEFITNETMYEKISQHDWDNDSKTKLALIRYCKDLITTYSTCHILASRESVAMRLGSIMGIHI